jgi:hypothetical protein
MLSALARFMLRYFQFLADDSGSIGSTSWSLASLASRALKIASSLALVRSWGWSASISLRMSSWSTAIERAKRLA